MLRWGSEWGDSRGATAYASSQARGGIGAVAISLCHSHSNTRSEPHLGPTPQFTATLDPLTHWGRPRDRTHVLKDTSWVRYSWATMGNSTFFLKKESIKDYLPAFSLLIGDSEKHDSSLLYPVFMIKEALWVQLNRRKKWLVIQNQLWDWWGW